MFAKEFRQVVSLLCVSVFFCALMFLPGCNMFGPDGGDTILPTPLATTGDSSVSFNVVLPEPSIRASVADRIRASSDQSVSVTFSITLIDTSTSRSWVVSKTVAVGADGKADASFTGLPDVTVVGEICIDGGTRGGFNEFHGAADLKTGTNDLNVSPKGSGLVADITAKLVIKAANNTDLAEKLPRNLATVAKSSAEQVGEAGDPLDLEKEAFNNFVSSNLKQATYVKLAIENNELKASGKETWQKPITELAASVDSTETNWNLNEVVSQGFGASAYVSIKSSDETKFALLKINSANGTVINWLVNEGNCKPVMVLGDDSVLVGGTLGGQPIVFRWDGISNKVLNSTDHTLNKWAKRLEVNGTVDVPEPIVENFALGAGDRLTCMLKDPETMLPITFVLNYNTGTIISEPRVSQLRVWAEGKPNAISIGWDLHAAAKSYNLYYAPGDTEPDKATSDKFTGVVPTHVHNNLEVDTTYKYLVTWVDKHDVEHEYTSHAKATALPAEEFAGGDGSEANPYQITSWVHLNNVRDNLDKHFVLKNNLTTETIGYEDYASDTANEGKGWSPLGDSNAINFSGIFDGAGHKIVALNIERDPEGYATGLFGYVNNGTIKNLTLEDASIKTLKYTGGDGSVGGIAGQVSGQSKIDNCHVSGVITNENHAAGGIVGKVFNKSIVSNCLNAASINGYSTTGGIAGTVGSSEGTDKASVVDCSNTGNITSEYNAGGISGDNRANGIIDFCTNTGNISNSSASNGGTIGGIVAQNAGKITNCHSDAVIHTTTDDAGARAGGIAGVHSGSETEGEITKCYSLGSVTSDKGSAGGLVGGLYTEGFIKKSFSHASVSSGYSAGGLVGETSTWHGSISDCYSTGSTVSDGHASGLVGRCYGYSDTIIQNSYSTGKVTGAEMSGGFCAPLNHSASVDSQAINCFWDINTSEQSNSYGDEMGKTTAEMVLEATFTGWSFDADNWKINEGHSYPYLAWQNGANIPYASVPSAPEFADGDGSEVNPYQITTWVHLNNVRDNLNKHFILKNNLTSQTEGYNDHAAATANAGQGWDPIGTPDNVFAGSLDGANHKIIDLNIERAEANGVGLFGSVGGSAIIKKLHLENAKINGLSRVGGIAGLILDEVQIDACSVNGTVSSEDYAVAGVVGSASNNSKIINSSNAASINGCTNSGGITGVLLGSNLIRDCFNTGDVTAESHAGGIAGYNSSGNIESCYNLGKITMNGGAGFIDNNGGSVGGIVANNRGKIDDCYSDATIHDKSSFDIKGDTGGIAGSNSRAGEISKSYSLGKVISDNGKAGGLAGYHAGDGTAIRRCFSNASVVGGNYAGGLVGCMYSATSVVSDSYCTGSVSSDENAGGLVGYFGNGNIENCYAIGAVTGSDTLGGFSSSLDASAQLSSCFWDMDTSGQSNSAGDAVGKTTSQMIQQATFTDWSFDADGWKINEGQSYPYLSWQDEDNIPAIPQI